VATGSNNGEARLWDAATGQPITPPRQGAPGFNVMSVALSPAGHPTSRARGGWGRLLAASADGAARLWTLGSDERSPQELARLAQLLAGARLDATGGLTSLEPAALLREWQFLRARYPADFQTAPEEMLAWHRQEAAESERAGLWEAAIGHMTLLIEAEPWNAELRLRRARAAAAAGQLDQIPPEEIRAWRRREADPEEQSEAWEAVLPHLTALVEAEPEDGELRLRRARAYLLTGRQAEAQADFLKAAALLPPAAAGGDLRPCVLKATQPAPGQPGLLGEYFASLAEAAAPGQGPPEATQRLLVRVDAAIDFDWGEGSPDPAVPAQDFQAPGRPAEGAGDGALRPAGPVGRWRGCGWMGSG
jgi:tetratricopeptide (TPR) repeat protein